MVELAIYAFVAAFIFFRLYGSLGRASSVNFANSSINPDGLVDDRAVRDAKSEPIDISVDSVAEEGQLASVTDGIESIREQNAEFSLRRFMAGASTAFEIIMEALGKGDTELLKSLLSANIYESFKKEIERRNGLGQVHENVVVSIVSQKISAARITGSIASITVKFITEQINIVRDASGDIIEGCASSINTVEDVWTFEKDAHSTSRKWYLAATS